MRRLVTTVSVVGLTLSSLAVAALYGSKTATESARQQELKELGFKNSPKYALTEDLLKRYKPSLPNDPVTTALKERFGSRKVILLDPLTNQIAIQATVDYAADLEQGFSEQEFVVTSDGPVRPVAIGENPERIADEDPIHPGLPLRNRR